jgi:hypothetical protein
MAGTTPAMARSDAPPSTIKTLSAAEAAEVDAIANLIVPGGATPGARDAHAIYFIDNALGAFFADQLPAFRHGLARFRRLCRRHRADKPFSAAPKPGDRLAERVDHALLQPAAVPVLGLIALPKYGGSRQSGWKLVGVEDNHMWAPPSAITTRIIRGSPYPGTKPYTA